MTTTMSELEARIDELAAKANAKIEAAKDVAAMVAVGARKVIDGAKQKARDGKRAFRDSAMHKIEELKGRLD